MIVSSVRLMRRTNLMIVGTCGEFTEFNIGTSSAQVPLRVRVRRLCREERGGLRFFSGFKQELSEASRRSSELALLPHLRSSSGSFTAAWRIKCTRRAEAGAPSATASASTCPNRKVSQLACAPAGGASATPRPLADSFLPVLFHSRHQPIAGPDRDGLQEESGAFQNNVGQRQRHPYHSCPRVRARPYASGDSC